MSLTARFPGECEDCDEPIRPGELIEGADPGWRHVTCPAPLDTTEPPACPVCFLTHPEGKCER